MFFDNLLKVLNENIATTLYPKFPKCSGRTFPKYILNMFCNNTLTKLNDNIARTLCLNVVVMFSAGSFL